MTLLLAASNLFALVALALLLWHRPPLSPAPRLTGKTVEIERAKDAINVRGLVYAQHSDRLTLVEPLGRSADGELVPLEHPVMHILPSQILSISEVG